MERFRGKYLGKCSPVHFFWGSFDLACSRFSGRLAPPRKGAISGPAYSHEVCSAGFWPGGGAVDGPAFYCYAVPAPAGFEKASIRPAAAGWNESFGTWTDDYYLAYGYSNTWGLPSALMANGAYFSGYLWADDVGEIATGFNDPDTTNPQSPLSSIKVEDDYPWILRAWSATPGVGYGIYADDQVWYVDHGAHQ